MNQNKDQDRKRDAGRGGPGDDMPMPGAGTSNAGHYTPNPAGRGGGIVSSSAEAQVNPPGKPQSGQGSATEPVAPGVAGIRSNEAAAGRIAGGAGGGDLGNQAPNADSNMSNSAGDD
ncbi:hypothetical protein LQ564_10110 [Massilia sp. G4R7]|uniref:Uncharacterized protein n=1 Tax=Massilia phyllostachyos TaxID=2898585 RepID=A0ABS8Q4I5_9BURK|nr:hypothetical protein [Massilia phyllostachyos]MCD2516659.1 hypothetical protein [Massilia phyllostachyos]